MIADELTSEAARVVVIAMPSNEGATTAPGLAGFAVGWRVAGENQILYLAVRPAARRGGLATALVGDLLASCGRGRAVLEVREGNAAARALYAGLGFSEVGRRPRYYRGGEAAVLMERAAAAAEEDDGGGAVPP